MTNDTTRSDMQKLIDNIHEMVNQYGDEEGFEEWCNVRAYIRTLEREHREMQQVIERAEYEGAMARGEFTHLCLDAGCTRLNNALNILKNARISSLTIK